MENVTNLPLWEVNMLATVQAQKLLALAPSTLNLYSPVFFGGIGSEEALWGFTSTHELSGDTVECRQQQY